MSKPEGDTTLTAMDRSGEPPKAIAELGGGARIGRYIVENRLGAGGMGVVYVAHDTELARDVALKIVRPRAEVDATQARLRREAKAMARLSHPNVVPVFDIGTHDGQLFIAMELVDGETLRAWVAKPRPWRAVVALFLKAGRGLEAAHAAGLLHRDFKPDNVVVGPGDEPRITDFGLARELQDETGAAALLAEGTDSELSLITRTGSLAGTPAYMAPEQLLGRQAGAAADQFSFCVSLFEALHGTRPFRPAAPRPDALVPEVRAGRIVKPRQPVPGWLQAAVVRGLAYEPDQRWPSMTALLDRLDHGRRSRRLGVIAAVAGAAVVAAGAAVMIITLRSDPTTPTCLEVAARANDAVTILVCRDEYARTNNPWTGRELADALRRTGKLREAATVATELLATTARAGALYTLGKVAAKEGRRDAAERSFRLASELHRAQQQWADSAGDLQAMALTSNDVIDQLVGYDEAARDAQRGHDARTEGICHLSAAEQLSEMGASAGAQAELTRAASLLVRPGDIIQLDLARGDVHQNLGEHEPAIAAFEQARAGAEAATNARLARSARLNLVYSLTETGKLTEADAELQAAVALDPTDQRIAARLSLEARIATRRGELARAAALVERSVAAVAPDEPEQLVERYVQRAEIALQQGDLTIGEQSARRAIALIEGARSNSPPVDLRSWLIVDRRIPYRLLVEILARRNDAAGALAAFERYRGLDVLAGLVCCDAAAAAPDVPISELARLVPQLAASRLATLHVERALDEALRDRSLLALVVVRDQLWRFTVDGGPPQIARIGAWADLRPQLDRLRAAPDDQEAAAALGIALIPPEVARPSDRVLHVVLDEPLVGLPLAALRVGDHRLVQARTIVQSVRASDLGCATRPPGSRRVMTLDASGATDDPVGGLPASIATPTALFGVTRRDRLVVTGLVERDALGEVLRVGRRRVRALEIAGEDNSAAQVVLALSDAGAAGSTRLAMAFLASGAEQVIAAIRPVSRAEIDQLTSRLDRPDVTDLARALAQLQRGVHGDDWLGFAAFGREICNP